MRRNACLFVHAKRGLFCVSHPPLPRGAVEPKVLFANERTFLNWMHTSTIIATIGMALLNLSPNSGAKASKIAGCVHTFIPRPVLR